MEVKLVVQSGRQAGMQIPITGEKFLVGRGEGCNLRPQSSQVSRKHCLILVAEGSATVEDCGSTNGTFLNNQRIAERCVLHNGDRLRVGMLDFEVQLGVSVGGKRKPKVNSVQEAAARTAGSSPSIAEDMDISGWLDEKGVTSETPTRQEPAVPSGDTMAGKSLTDTSTLPAVQPVKVDEENSSEAKPHQPKKTPGKLPHSSKPMAENSGSAADDVLRQFFHRRNP